MSRRSLLTVRRVVILYITPAVLLFVFVVCYMHTLYYIGEISSPFTVILVLGAAFYFSVTAFAYYKDQNQVQTNENAIDIQRYKNSVFIIMYIRATSLLSYVPFVCCVAVVRDAELGKLRIV